MDAEASKGCLMARKPAATVWTATHTITPEQAASFYSRTRVTEHGIVELAKNRHAVTLGRKGGRAKSKRKAKSSAANGKKGGRPKKS